MLSRRSAFKAAAGIAATAGVGFTTAAQAADKSIKIGMDLSLTGADSESAIRVGNGAIMAFDEANQYHEVPGIKFDYVKFDDGTATAGQYDPAQAATNARKMVSDKGYVAALGPQMSGAGKAMSPILSEGNLAIITPSSTNPDITDPKYAAQYRPAGKAVYFRTVTTDAYQGPNMANYLAKVVGIKSVYVLDDSGAYGVGIADSFQKRCEEIGVKVMGRDRLDPKAADYSAVLTKIKGLNPDCLYYGGVAQAGVKLAKQVYEILPKIIKAGGDGILGVELLKGAGFPAADGWYATNASPHKDDADTKMKQFSDRFTARFKVSPDDYTLTMYVAARCIIETVKVLQAAGKPITRDSVRDGLQNIHMENSLIGPVEFDENGDLKNKVISVFKVTKDASKPLDSMDDQFKYEGIAPMS
jgi:branched-chain amino acid transport system substrate-binding protein